MLPMPLAGYARQAAIRHLTLAADAYTMRDNQGTQAMTKLFASLCYALALVEELKRLGKKPEMTYDPICGNWVVVCED